MSNGSEIFSSIPNIDYSESAEMINVEEFIKVIKSRRSVRVFDGTPIPDQIVHECIDLALLAPNSSNLQPWEFIRIKSPEVKNQIIEACLSQPAAKTAAELIVCIARTNTWKRNSTLMLSAFEKIEKEKGTKTPNSALQYYKKLVPIVYTQGVFSILGFLKAIIVFIRGFKTPTPREPISNNDMKIWAVKSTALACENLMLSFRAFGYDTCPMEGLDSSRVKKILKLSNNSIITMIISAGKRAPNGVYGPRVRFDRKLFVKEI